MNKKANITFVTMFGVISMMLVMIMLQSGTLQILIGRNSVEDVPVFTDLEAIHSLILAETFQTLQGKTIGRVNSIVDKDAEVSAIWLNFVENHKLNIGISDNLETLFSKSGLDSEILKRMGSETRKDIKTRITASINSWDSIMLRNDPDLADPRYDVIDLEISTYLGIGNRIIAKIYLVEDAYLVLNPSGEVTLHFTKGSNIKLKYQRLV